MLHGRVALLAFLQACNRPCYDDGDLILAIRSFGKLLARPMPSKRGLCSHILVEMFISDISIE